MWLTLFLPCFTLVLTQICSFVKDVVNHQFKPKAVWVLSGVYLTFAVGWGVQYYYYYQFRHVATLGFGGDFSILGPKSYVCFLYTFFRYFFLTFFDLFFNPSSNPTLSVWE